MLFFCGISSLKLKTRDVKTLTAQTVEALHFLPSPLEAVPVICWLVHSWGWINTFCLILDSKLNFWNLGTWVGPFPLIDAAAVADFRQLQILLFLLLVPHVICYEVVAAMESVKDYCNDSQIHIEVECDCHHHFTVWHDKSLIGQMIPTCTFQQSYGGSTPHLGTSSHPHTLQIIIGIMIIASIL